ncbi:MAG: hypothetical protein SGCHY_005149 [Lobulomycetales sp.]
MDQGDFDDDDDLAKLKCAALNWAEHGVFLQDDATWTDDVTGVSMNSPKFENEGDEDSNEEDNWQNEYPDEDEDALISGNEDEFDLASAGNDSFSEYSEDSFA